MGGFGSSIDDLLKKKDSEDEAGDKKPDVSRPISTAKEKLQKKLKKVSLIELEVDTQRQAQKMGFPHISLEKFPISQNALRQMSENEVAEKEAVCFFATPDEIRIGALDPRKQEVQDLLHELEERNNAHGDLYLISQSSLDRVLELYKTLPVVKAVTKDIEIKSEALQQVQASVNDFNSLQELLKKKSTSDILIYILGAAMKLEASDMHIEAEDENIIVRLRIDGILHDAAKLPKEIYKKLISRIKLMSSLKINITDKPQDGRFTIKREKKEGNVDVRVSTIPTIYGESVVMRLLIQSREGLTLDKLGMHGDAYEKLLIEIQRPNGMIITTGPTGSGKTTTLYAIMMILNKPGVKIITLEDPVEYKMEGINQSQIEKGRDYTFAKGLRSMMRQDPDIAMVGEIRDLETSDIAIQAALTGHLMLSTIHTNSASGAIPRFLSMGVKPFLLAPALNSIIGQRLVRKVCQECKKPVEIKPRQMEHVKQIIESMAKKEKEQIAGKEMRFYMGEGCTACSGIGYKGRVGIYEIMIMNPTIEGMILSGNVSELEIEKVAIENGMVTMVQDGILKALNGETSIDEVFRVTE